MPPSEPSPEDEDAAGEPGPEQPVPA